MNGILTFKKKIKTVLQSETSECGLACLTMLANYHSHDVSLSYMRSLFPTSHRGMTLAEIVDLAGQLDLDAQGLSVTNIAEMPNLNCPALLHWNGNHFVVLEKVVNGVFHVHDPAFGLRTYSAEDMERHFSGVALEFEPRVKFSVIKAQKKSKFWAVFRSCRGIENVIAVIVVLSFAANLFALASPIFLQIALDTVIPQYDLDLLAIVAIGMLLFATFDAASRWLRDIVTLRAMTIFEIFFTRNIVGHAFRLPLKFFELRHPGDFITRLSSIDEVRTFLISGFVSSATDGVMSILLVTMMFYYSPTMAAVSVGTLVVALALRAATYPKIARFTTEYLDARSEEQGKLIDGLKSAAALKVHNTSEFFNLKWFDSFTRFANMSFRTKKLTIDTDLMLHVVFTVGTVATLYIGVTDVMKNTASVGILYAFFALRTTFFTNMNALIINLLQVSIMRVHLARLDDVIDEKEEQGATRNVMDRAIRQTVSLENITIQFDAGSRPLLDKINLTVDVEGGEAIAIVGESGSGKSSLLKVLASLHQPRAGQLLVDGQTIDKFGLHEYRANLGAVFAEDVMFAGTVADNITMYAPDVTREQMEKSLRAVGLLEEIYRLPQGFATLLSDESPVLSTGQRRRLMLARAMCRKPRLLLLDEITANLDPRTEDKIAQALADMPAAKILVTHSERLLRRVDRVFKVVDGNLVEIEPIRPKISA